ncbi:hypothetical protein M422DRAFT_52736 [Sphaerobolus stellatus SS14]|uniref:Uncharacterized protein n=1 Tax=Sphaerobolus stellatus (strain SS14) TaxID=990650 RepID=A0A0C9V5A1_SPHS4|nr:hypothetical protein M422DRAFT_52736 [Sphaerobolus stellatus SS14]
MFSPSNNDAVDRYLAVAIRAFRSELWRPALSIKHSGQVDVMAYSLRSMRNQAAYNDALANILSTNDNGTIRGTGRGGTGQGCDTLPTQRTDLLLEDDTQTPQDYTVRGRGRGRARAQGRGRPRGRGRGRGRVRGQSEVSRSTEFGVEPTEEQVRQNRGRQREARLLQNERERQANEEEMERFFAQSSPVQPSLLARSPCPPHSTLVGISGPHQSDLDMTTIHTPTRHAITPIQQHRSPLTVHFQTNNTPHQTPGSAFRRPVLQGSMVCTRVSDTAGGRIFTCKLCPLDAAYRYSHSNGTSTLRRHIMKKHPYKYVNFYKKSGMKIEGKLAERLAKLGSSGSGSDKTITIHFSQEAFHSALVNFIVANDLVSKLNSLYLSVL